MGERVENHFTKDRCWVLGNTFTSLSNDSFVARRVGIDETQDLVQQSWERAIQLAPCDGGAWARTDACPSHNLDCCSRNVFARLPREEHGRRGGHPGVGRRLSR